MGPEGGGEGAGLAGAGVVVDLTHSPTFEDASPVFFRTSMPGGAPAPYWTAGGVP
ncbi:hypothetical protein [Streptomyces microflavus]|uniref:hypothetical protein n=1 Tax=Streptomyces microflavus TaxID=1919 RepID=UPI003B218929